MITDTLYIAPGAKGSTDRWVHDTVMAAIVMVIFILPAGLGAMALFG